MLCRSYSEPAQLVLVATDSRPILALSLDATQLIVHGPTYENLAIPHCSRLTNEILQMAKCIPVVRPGISYMEERWMCFYSSNFSFGCELRFYLKNEKAVTRNGDLANTFEFDGK